MPLGVSQPKVNGNFTCRDRGMIDALATIYMQAPALLLVTAGEDAALPLPTW
jgi:hypothetical protein